MARGRDFANPGLKEAAKNKSYMSFLVKITRTKHSTYFGDDNILNMPPRSNHHRPRKKNVNAHNYGQMTWCGDRSFGYLATHR